MDLVRGYVATQAEENRGAQVAVVRPFRELHLRNKFRPHPGGLAFDLVGEGLLASPQRLEARLEDLEHVAVEAAADVAGVDELAIVVVVADGQGSEGRGAP